MSVPRVQESCQESGGRDGRRSTERECTPHARMGHSRHHARRRQDGRSSTLYVKGHAVDGLIKDEHDRQIEMISHQQTVY